MAHVINKMEKRNKKEKYSTIDVEV